MGKKQAADERCLALGQKIKKLRELRGQTQEGLAEKADIDTSYIGQIERGLRYPSLKVLFRIADALNVKIIELFKEVSTQKAK
ncbi:MAG: helix-turn-helix transcriptional regulator [Deltaproteobacteria bacterium]|nr:helix-turn-helix transcriptional regulator [Deltaproteobacteria bacterium]